MEFNKIREKLAREQPAIKEEGNCLICNPRNPNFLKEYTRQAASSNNFQRLLTFMKGQLRNTQPLITSKKEELEGDYIHPHKRSTWAYTRNLEMGMVDLVLEFYEIDYTPLEAISNLDTETSFYINTLNSFKDTGIKMEGDVSTELLNKIKNILNEEIDELTKTFNIYLGLAKKPRRLPFGIKFDIVCAKREAGIYGNSKWAFTFADEHANGIYYLIDKFGYPEWDEEKIEIFETTLATLKERIIKTELKPIIQNLKIITASFKQSINSRIEIFEGSIIKRKEEIENNL